MLHLSRHRLVIAAVLAAAAIAPVAVIAAADPSPPEPGTPAPSGVENRAKVDRISAALSARFGVLRREAQPADRMPDALARMGEQPAPLTGAAAEPDTTVEGVNPALARRVARSPDGAVFLLPGDSGLCLATTRTDVPGGVTCARAEQVISNGLYFTQAASPQGGRRVEGIVPDGVSAVRIGVDGGTSMTQRVNDNAFSVDVAAGEPTTLTWLDQDGAALNEQPVP